MYNGTGEGHLKHLQHRGVQHNPADSSHIWRHFCQCFLVTYRNQLPATIQKPTTWCERTKTIFPQNCDNKTAIKKKRKKQFSNRGKHSTLTKVTSKVYRQNGNTEKFLGITVWIYLSLFSNFVRRQNTLQNLGLVTAKTIEFISASNIHYIPARDGQGMPTAGHRTRGDLIPTDTTERFPAESHTHTSLS